MRTTFDKVARLATRQHGRVSWMQLVELGVHPSRIKRWLAQGLLIRVHHGVYAIGHTAPSALGDLVAANLACGPGTRTSHASVGHLLKLVSHPPREPEVTVPTTAGLRRPGIVIHRVRELPDLDTSTFDGIEITTVPRALLDLAPRLEPEDLTYAIHQAWIHHGTTPGYIEACLERNPHKPGRAKLRRALGTDVTLSMLERAFLKLLRRHGLPLPRTNIDVRGDKVDCHWPELGLTIELHSYRFHASRQAFETDLARRRRSGHAAFSYGDIVEREAATVAELRSLLFTRTSRPVPSRFT